MSKKVDVATGAPDATEAYSLPWKNENAFDFF